MKDQLGINKHPCDQCRRRKVRCNYGSPCDRCQNRSLTCTSESTRRKPGRKPGAGVVVEQLQRESGLNDEDRASTTPSTAAPQDRSLGGSDLIPEADSIHSPYMPRTYPVSNSVTSQPLDRHLADPGPVDHSDLTATWVQNDSFYTFDDFAQSVLNSSSTAWNANPTRVNEAVWSPLDHSEEASTTTARTPHPFAQPQTPHTISTDAAAESWPPRDISTFDSNDTVVRSVDLFFRHLYPTYPILVKAQIRAWLANSPPPKRSELCLLRAVCAATLVHVDSWPDLTFEQRTSMARSYITLCLQTRLSGKSLESPSFADVVSSLFIAITYFELRRRTTSWIYVREAITLAMASGLHTAGTNMSLTHEERIQQQRCYALLFITERGASILDNFPISIMSVPVLSDNVLPGEDPSILLGLKSLCHLFSLLDSAFVVRVWNDLPLSSDENYGYIEFANLQEHLRRPIDLSGVSDIQRADILITQQWLRLVFWQAQLRLGLITTTSADPTFNYNFPAEIASSLCDVVKSLPPVAIQVHGLGIFKKQFEIAYSLLDALTLSNPGHASAYYETLRYLLFSLSASPTSQQIYVKTLQKRIGGGDQKYRSVVDVELLRIDEPRHPTTHPEQSTHVGDESMSAADMI